MGDCEVYTPPPGAPPLLTPEQIIHLAYQGWLPIDLDTGLGKTLQRLSQAASSFFDLKDNEKASLYPPSRGTECGFYHVPDEKEYITIRHGLHEHSELELQASKVWHDVGILFHRVLCDLSRAGGLSLNAWDHLLEATLDLPRDDSDLDNTISLMRLFRYYPASGTAAEHVDLGLLTLCVGEGQGLQVLDRSTDPPQYIDADGPTILVGDFARALMQNRIRAGKHRVIGNPLGRHSTVFALRPCLRHSTDLATFGGQGVVGTKEYYYRVKGSKFNVNATQEIRDRQRKAQEEKRSRVQQQALSPSNGAG